MATGLRTGGLYLHVEPRQARVRDDVSVVVALALGDAVRENRRFLAHDRLARNRRDGWRPAPPQLTHNTGTGQCVVTASWEHIAGRNRRDVISPAGTHLAFSECCPLQVEARRTGQGDCAPHRGQVLPADHQSGDRGAGGQGAGTGSAADAVSGPRAVALTDQRGRRCRQLVVIVTPGREDVRGGT